MSETPTAAAGVRTNGLTDLEIVSHVLFGRDARTPLPPPTGATAHEALEASILRALQRPPCLVTFSGGRDSSAVLAVAARLAAREGLPAPIPLTGTYLAAPESEEREWQEIVIRHLGLDDWWCRQYGDELDLVGPVAAELLRRDGLPYPFNLHLLLPLIQEASGGSLVTGVGGDQMLHPAGAFRDVLARRRRPTLRDAAWTAAGFLPRPVRRRLLRDDVELRFPWLTEPANARLTAASLEQELSESITWSRQVVELWRSRPMQENVRRIGALADEHDVAIVHPFVEPAFVSAFAREGGRFGFPTRTAAMERLFSDVLPPKITSRPTKATFDEVVFNRHTKAFLGDLDEERLRSALAALGVAPLVDPLALLAEWHAPRPQPNSFLLLQACWLVLER